MKGFSEERGQMSRMGYDEDTKQFGPQPIPHPFQPHSLREVIWLKLSELLKGRNLKQAKAAILQQLAGMTPEQRDDIGMTEIFAASQTRADDRPHLQN